MYTNVQKPVVFVLHVDYEDDDEQRYQTIVVDNDSCHFINVDLIPPEFYGEIDYIKEYFDKVILIDKRLAAEVWNILFYQIEISVENIDDTDELAEFEAWEEEFKKKLL